jgi:hypothetical protein
MKTEEQKKDLEWLETSGMDFDVKGMCNNCHVTETKPIWVEYWTDEYESLLHKGIAKFGLITDLDTEETVEALSVFHGFEAGMPWWQEEYNEYYNLRWCELEDIIRGFPRMKKNKHGLLYFEMDGSYHFCTPDLMCKKRFHMRSTQPDDITYEELTGDK